MKPLIQLIADKMEKVGIGTNSAELARMANLNTTSVWRILKEPEQVSTDNIYKVLKALDLLKEESSSNAAADQMEYLIELNNLKDKYIKRLEELNKAYQKIDELKNLFNIIASKSINAKRNDDSDDFNPITVRTIYNKFLSGILSQENAE